MGQLKINQTLNILESEDNRILCFLTVQLKNKFIF